MSEERLTLLRIHGWIDGWMDGQNVYGHCVVRDSLILHESIPNSIPKTQCLWIPSLVLFCFFTSLMLLLELESVEEEK